MAKCCPNEQFGCLNSLWPSDVILWHRSGSTLAQVVSCCQSPGLHLNHCWLISEVQWNPHLGNFTGNTYWNMLLNHTLIKSKLKSDPYISGDSELKQPHTYNKEPIRFLITLQHILMIFSEWLSRNTYCVNHYAWVPYINVVNMVAVDSLGPGHLQPPFLPMIVNFQLISYQDAPEWWPYHDIIDGIFYILVTIWIS